MDRWLVYAKGIVQLSAAVNRSECVSATPSRWQRRTGESPRETRGDSHILTADSLNRLTGSQIPVVNVALLLAVSVNNEGHRETLGLDIATGGNSPEPGPRLLTNTSLQADITAVSMLVRPRQPDRFSL